jgi:uncharacterized membrane protein HdeD (DUF308 family)
MAENPVYTDTLGTPTWHVAWWDVLLRGLIAIAFGLALLLWPGLSLKVFVYLFAALAFFDGILVLLQMVTIRDGKWLSRMLHGLVAIAAAAAVVLWPGLTLLSLAFLLGVYWIVTGALEILYAIDLRKVIRGELLLIAAGILSIIAGGILIFYPLVGLVAFAQVVGIFNIALGIILVLLAAKLALTGTKAPAPAA